GTREPRCLNPACNERDPFALTGAHPHILCYECRAEAQARGWTEGHHWLGRQNDQELVDPLPGNEHRRLSEYQLAWPKETLRNPQGSPLLRAAAAIRCWLDVLRLLIERVLVWVPEFLEYLDAWLREQLGPEWWRDIGPSPTTG